MNLNEAGQTRVRGYMLVLQRSLESRLPRNLARDAMREIESYISARVAAAAAGGDQRLALERILAELGTPLRVAQAYSSERTLDEAVLTGRVLPILRAIVNAAFATVFGFVAAIVLFTGYVAGAAFLVIGIAKPIFPANVGIWSVNGPGSFPTSLGFRWNTTEAPAGGNWVILIGVVAGLTFLGLTHWGARAFLRWYRERRAPAFPLAT